MSKYDVPVPAAMYPATFTTVCPDDIFGADRFLDAIGVHIGGNPRPILIEAKQFASKLYGDPKSLL